VRARGGSRRRQATGFEMERACLEKQLVVEKLYHKNY
jgi:hypothetical protein